MQFDQKFICLFEILLPCWHYFESAYIPLLTLIYTFIFLQCHGDLNKTQVQKKLRKNSLSVCHWHLNSLSAPNFSKHFHLKAYDSIHKQDFTCLSETCLDSSTPDNVIDIEGYNLVCANYPDNIIRGGVRSF